MKTVKFSLLMIFILVIQFNISSQTDSTKKVRIGLTCGMSFFGPSGVNQYIKDKVSGMTFYQGFPEIILNLNGSFSVIYKINDQSDIAGILDLALAPKFISVNNGGGYDFYFFRFSPGVIGNLYFGSSNESKFLMGGGVLLNIMSFDGFSGFSPGLRLQAGQSFRMGDVIVKAMGVINLMIPAHDGIDLNYTDIGGVVGIEF